MSAAGDFFATAAAVAVALLWCGCLTGADASLTYDGRLGVNLKEISERSPYKYVRDVIVAAEGETKTITCSFDSLHTAGKHWKRTFYSPVTWFSYPPGAKPAAAEQQIADGKVVPLGGGKQFAYKLLNPMSVAPSSVLVLESVPLQLSGTYFACKTSLQPGSVQAFYLKVVKPILHTPGAASGGRVRAKLGSSLKLDCSAANNFPMTSVYWSRRRIDAKWAVRRPVLAWGPTYELASVTAEAAKYQYTCHVNNHLDPEWTANFRIDLINAGKLKPGPITATYNGVRPAFRTSSSQAVPRYDSPYTMSCRAQGDGLNFAWLKNGTELQAYADPNLYTYSSSLGSLHFTDLILRKFRTSDRGVYECRARNEAGDSVFVFDLESLGPSPPPDAEGPQLPGGGVSAGGDKSQRQGSGWGAGGSGDDEADDAAPPPQQPSPAASATAAGSGDRRSPMTPASASAGQRHRVRRHWRKARRLPLP